MQRRRSKTRRNTSVSTWQLVHVKGGGRTKQTAPGPHGISTTPEPEAGYPDNT